MNLVIRYVQAVKNELPKHNRDDIARELQSTLLDELEALSEKGQLSEAQVAAFLEQRGHPVQVASQYWKRRSLVSEAAYPLYKQALVFFCSLYLALGVLLRFEDFQVTRNWESIGKLPNLFFDLLGTVGFAFVVLTLVFHYFGEEIAEQKWFWKFNPSKLPDVSSQAAYISRVQSITDLLLCLLGLSLLTFGSVTFRNLGLNVNWSPIATWLELLRYLLLADLGLNLWHLVQPYWTRAKLWVSAILKAGMVFCLGAMIVMPKVVEATGGIDTNALISLELSLRVTFAVFIAVVLWSFFDTVRRLWKVKLPVV